MNRRKFLTGLASLPLAGKLLAELPKSPMLTGNVIDSTGWHKAAYIENKPLEFPMPTMTEIRAMIARDEIEEPNVWRPYIILHPHNWDSFIQAADRQHEVIQIGYAPGSPYHTEIDGVTCYEDKGLTPPFNVAPGSLLIAGTLKFPEQDPPRETEARGDWRWVHPGLWERKMSLTERGKYLEGIVLRSADAQHEDRYYTISKHSDKSFKYTQEQAPIDFSNLCILKG